MQSIASEQQTCYNEADERAIIVYVGAYTMTRYRDQSVARGTHLSCIQNKASIPSFSRLTKTIVMVFFSYFATLLVFLGVVNALNLQKVWAKVWDSNTIC